MLKQLRFLLQKSRGFRYQNSNLLEKAGDAREIVVGHARKFQATFASATEQRLSTKGLDGKVFAPYSIFKGKAALSVEPVLPIFSKLESGGLKVERHGVIMLCFRPAIGERKYDNERRQIFALSATEVGSLISMGPKDSADFFHDPALLSSNAGQVRKSLSIKAHDDGRGYFISLSIANNILKTNDRITVPVTIAEFAVMKTACNFVLPHILGWDRMTSTQRGSGLGTPLKANLRETPDLEWAK